MPLNLFTVFLESGLKKISDWAVGKILKVKDICPKCKERHEHRIGNLQHNDFYCSNCSRHISQYTNANENTISAQNQIAHAYLGLGCANHYWYKKRNFWGRITDWYLDIPYFIQIDGLRGKNAIFQIDLNRLDNDEIIKSDCRFLYTSENRTIYDDYHWSFNEENLGKIEDKSKQILIVDTKILTPTKEILINDRRLIKPW